MDLLDFLDTAVGRTIAWGSVLTILAGLLRWGWRLSKRLHQLADAFLGNPDPDPVKHRPSLPERVESIEKLQGAELDFPADLVRCRAITAAWVARGAIPDAGIATGVRPHLPEPI